MLLDGGPRKTHLSGAQHDVELVDVQRAGHGLISDGTVDEELLDPYFAAQEEFGGLVGGENPYQTVFPIGDYYISVVNRRGYYKGVQGGG